MQLAPLRSTGVALLALANVYPATPMLTPAELGLASRERLPATGGSGPSRPRIVFRFKAPPPDPHVEPLRTISTVATSESSSSVGSYAAGVGHSGEATSNLKAEAAGRRSVEPRTTHTLPQVMDKAAKLWQKEIPLPKFQLDTLKTLATASDEGFKAIVARRMHNILSDRRGMDAADRRRIHNEIDTNLGLPRWRDTTDPELRVRRTWSLHDKLAATQDPEERVRLAQLLKRKREYGKRYNARLAAARKAVEAQGSAGRTDSEVMAKSRALWHPAIPHPQSYAAATMKHLRTALDDEFHTVVHKRMRHVLSHTKDPDILANRAAIRKEVDDQLGSRAERARARDP